MVEERTAVDDVQEVSDQLIVAIVNQIAPGQAHIYPVEGNLLTQS